MAADLVEAWRNASAKARHSTGGLTLVCLDDESLDESEYARMGDRTIVPRAREEGGIKGLPLGNDCKYGKGVTRRRLADDGNGGFVVESTEDNFRPDKAAEADLFSDEMLAEAGIELVDDDPEDYDIPEDDPLEMLKKQAREALSQPQPAPTAPQHNGNDSMMMQMMGLLTQVVAGQQQKPAQVTEKPKPAPKPTGKSVSFSGDFGRITVKYADVMVQADFLVLVSIPDQPTAYEPPLSAQRPLTLEVDGVRYSVMNLGLSFSHKGDILHLMPFALNQEDSDAEQTE